MLLPDHEIRELIAARRVVSPYDPALVQPAGIDVRLGKDFEVFERGQAYFAIDPGRRQPGMTRHVTPKDDDGFLLHPGEFALGATAETLAIPDDIAVQLNGKSSLGRLGLVVHSTAGWIDPGFTGQLTLELASFAPLPIILRPGMRIAQLCFFRLGSAARQPYGTAALGSRYQGQEGPTPARPYLHRLPAGGEARA